MSVVILNFIVDIGIRVSANRKKHGHNSCVLHEQRNRHVTPVDQSDQVSHSAHFYLDRFDLFRHSTVSVMHAIYIGVSYHFTVSGLNTLFYREHETMKGKKLAEEVLVGSIIESLGSIQSPEDQENCPPIGLESQ
jgi:hypothetical protein